MFKYAIIVFRYAVIVFRYAIIAFRYAIIVFRICVKMGLRVQYHLTVRLANKYRKRSHCPHDAI